MGVQFMQQYSTEGFSIRADQPDSNAYWMTAFATLGIGSGTTWKAILNFPMWDLNSGQTVFSATMSSFRAFIQSGNQMNIWAMNSSWGAFTWNSIAYNGATYIATVQLGPAGSWFDVNVTPIVQYDAAHNLHSRYYSYEDDPNEGYNTFGSVGNRSYFPVLNIWFGTNLSGLSWYTPYPRAVTGYWNGSPGADRYDCYLYVVGSGALYTSGSTSGTSITFPNIPTYQQYILTVYPIYNGYGNAAPQSTGAINTAPAIPNPPTVAFDTPLKKELTFYNQGSYLYGNSSWDYHAWIGDNTVGPNTVEVAGQTAGSTVINLMGMTYHGGSTGVYQRARYSDGDVSQWSAVGVGLTTEPAITNLTATSNLYREIDLTWTTLKDAAYYNVFKDGGAAVKVNQPGSGSTAYCTFTDIKSGQHTFVVTPVYTNGYTGMVTSGNISGTAILPTPIIPTAVADSPKKRQITVTGTALYLSDGFEFRRDGDDKTIITTAGTSNTFTKVPQGNHAVQVRAVWSDGDKSPWSTALGSLLTTTPFPTTVAARQKSAPIGAPTVTVSGTGMTGAYFVATSVNLATTRTAVTIGTQSRAYNESSPSDITGDPFVLSNQGIIVTKPTNCTGTDTWNIYMGTDRNNLKRIQANLTVATTTKAITAYTAPTTNEAKLGGVDLSWVAPTGQDVTDTVTYRVERAPSNPINVANGSPGAYVDVTALGGGVPGLGSGIYLTTNFWHDGLDTKYWFFKVTALYNNDSSTPIEIAVTA